MNVIPDTNAVMFATQEHRVVRRSDRGCSRCQQWGDPLRHFSCLLRQSEILEEHLRRQPSVDRGRSGSSGNGHASDHANDQSLTEPRLSVRLAANGLQKSAACDLEVCFQVVDVERANNDAGDSGVSEAEGNRLFCVKLA